ncbi:MAG: D-alanyl-D-alanine carboxypeptidase [Solobacterium sp.]|nr:D-alanyl-D-alanine carboxypeptidase [Solobacterium sp.]
MLSLLLCFTAVTAEEPPYSEENFPEVTSDYVCLYDTANAQLLYDGRMDEMMYPASITKVMTAVLAIESFDDLEQTILIEPRMWTGLIEANASVAGFQPGDQPTVRDLLYGVLLPSGADAVQALAITNDGSVEAFVDHMNAKAKEIGMANTHFTNATGLHDRDHYSTAADMALLFEYALSSPLFQEIIASRDYLTSPLASSPDGLYLESTSWGLINNGEDTYQIPGFLGGKTGFTNPAGRCFASHAEFNGMHLILVTGHSENTGHIADAAKVYNFYEQNYAYRTVAEASQEIARIPIEDSFDAEEIVIRMPETIAFDLPKDAKISVEQNLPETIHAPLNEGDPLGKVTVRANGQLLREFDITSDISARHSQLLHFKNQAIAFYNSHKTLCIFLACLLGVLILLPLILKLTGRKAKSKKRRKRRRSSH